MNLLVVGRKPRVFLPKFSGHVDDRFTSLPHGRSQKCSWLQDRGIDALLNGTNQWETDGRPDHFLFLDFGVEVAAQHLFQYFSIPIDSMRNIGMSSTFKSSGTFMFSRNMRLCFGISCCPCCVHTLIFFDLGMQMHRFVGRGPGSATTPKQSLTGSFLKESTELHL